MHLLRPSFPILLALTSWVHATTEPRIDSLLPGASLPFSTPEFRDLDNDGRLDLTLTSYGWGSGNTVWLRNLGNRTFADASLIARHLTSDGQQSLVDLDGDSRPDVFTAAADPAVSGHYLPVTYLVDPSFSGRNRIQLSTESADWWMAADLDGLPGAELVAEKKSGAAGGSQLTIYSRTSGGALAIWDTTPLNLPWNGQAKLHAADFDGDGDLDFEVTSASYDAATLFERRGTTPDGKANFVAHPLAPFTLEGDLDGDGIVDHAGDTTGDFRYQLSVPGTEGLEIAPA
ncbi:MAG: hypothetical protein JWO82_1351, partial [Akkermansiaceae bacterium]|nr:hypothetical protein [Akkermansiaceae bacterium]